MSANLYTASRLKVLRECLRKHLYKYVLRIRMPETDVSAFGTWGHKALEAWYREWQKCADQVTAEQLQTIRLAAALDVVRTAPIHPVDRVKLGVLVRAYDARWGGENWEILAVEVEFRYELGGYLIGGKIDALIRDRNDGRIYVVEHKTTGLDVSHGSAYWEKLAIDTQVSIYVDGATLLGHEIAGCVYDVIKRPAHELLLATPIEKRKFTVGKGCKKCGGSAKCGEVEKGRGYYIVSFPPEPEKQIECDGCAGTGWKLDKEGKPEAPRLHSHQRDRDETLEEFEERLIEAIAENPDASLLRGTVVRLDHELPRMREDLIEQIKVERHSDLHGLWPRNPESCSRYGRLCEFFDACVGRESIDNQLRFPRSDTAHPELAAAA